MFALTAIEFTAVLVSATYGILLASRKGMDFVGVCAVAFVASFGGGTLRDLFLDRHPLFWIKFPHYPVAVFCLCLLALPLIRHLPRVRPLLAFPDALGTGLFTVVGAGFALESGTTWFLAALLGVVTGTFGGVLADIVCNEIPALFRPGELFAVPSFAGACTFLLADHLLPAGTGWPLAIGVITVVTLRLLSIRYSWRLPPLRAHSDQGGTST